MDPTWAAEAATSFREAEHEKQRAPRLGRREPLSGVPTRHAHYWPGVTGLQVDTTPFNPDWDATPTGGCTLKMEEGRHYVFAHDEKGRMVGALKGEVIDRLYDRYAESAGTDHTDQGHTPEGGARRRAFEGREPQLGRIYGFATEIVLLLKSYSCEEEEEIKKSALQNHWTLPPEIMQALQEAFGIQAEFNPEYTAKDLDKAPQEALMSIMARSPVLGARIYPPGQEHRPPPTAADTETLSTRVWGCPEEELHLPPPDHWGGTDVSGVTNKDYINWGVRILVVANTEGWQKFCPDPGRAAEILGEALKRTKSAVDNVSQYDVVFDPHPMRKWEIPSMSRKLGWGHTESEVPKEDHTSEVARSMRQTWRDRGLSDITITEYHAANTVWPLEKSGRTRKPGG
ncbi:hypothetical protein CYMTET_10944 [Cymbomonas tetramitiformis]|uniref:Uncharacterized protein n=1 Tax=Cymbomonas tetramitiformis TaxID=36881 RepID=A0AAE0LDY2_9CHLO|nr:hypothetical protein CYMTET_10944 [Cymbomonas tetramitiformis]